MGPSPFGGVLDPGQAQGAGAGGRRRRCVRRQTAARPGPDTARGGEHGEQRTPATCGHHTFLHSRWETTVYR